MAEGRGERVYQALVAAKPPALTLSAWALRAGVGRSIFADLRRHGNPTSGTLEKLFDVEGASQARYEAALSPRREEPDQMAGRVMEDPIGAFRQWDRPKDVPVLGTPSCGEYVVRTDDGEQHIETIDIDLDGQIDWVRRPPAYDGRKDLYAIYPQGFSMVPRFEPGEVQYVEGGKPPAIGDYVVVQLKAEDPHGGERIVSALLKRLVRQSAAWIELEQFNPPLVFRIDRKRVARVERILRLDEVVSY